MWAIDAFAQAAGRAFGGDYNLKGLFECLTLVALGKPGVLKPTEGIRVQAPRSFHRLRM